MQISDLHGRRFDAESRYLLELVRLQSPDLIALTGDLADEFTDFSMLPPLLDGLTALAPTFYVTGNHEWVLSREKREALFSMLDAAGVVRLQNEYRLLKKGQASIVLAGVDDPNGPYDQKRPAQLVREIRQSRGRDAYILMLSHRNDELDLWAKHGRADCSLRPRPRRDRAAAVRRRCLRDAPRSVPGLYGRAVPEGADQHDRQPRSRRQPEAAAAHRQPPGDRNRYFKSRIRKGLNFL